VDLCKALGGERFSTRPGGNLIGGFRRWLSAVKAAGAAVVVGAGELSELWHETNAVAVGIGASRTAAHRSGPWHAHCWWRAPNVVRLYPYAEARCRTAAGVRTSSAYALFGVNVGVRVVAGTGGARAGRNVLTGREDDDTLRGKEMGGAVGHSRGCWVQY